MHRPYFRADLARGTSASMVALLLAAACGGGGRAGDDGDAGVEDPIPLVFPDEPFRATRPTPGAAAPFDPPRPETFTLPNGLQVILVERRTVPHVSWYVTFPTGSMQDPPGSEGLTSLCLNVAYQATREVPRQERERRLADMGANVGLGVSTNAIMWSGDAPREHLRATVELWQDLFLAPALGQEDFDGTQRVRVNALAAGASQSPAAVSSRVSSRLYWGPAHPYNRESTAASLKKVTLGDCQELFNRAVHPMGAKLFLSGAISRAEVTTEFARLGALAPATAPAMAPPLPAAARVPGALFFVHSAGAPQSIITLRGAGPARAAPEYFAAELMASILAGGSITSRIGFNLRETHGYAYSLGGSFSYSFAGTSFFFSAPVRADATAESVVEILEEIRKVRESGVTAEELERERRGRIAELPYLFETAGDTLYQYELLDGHALPFDYFTRYAPSFAAVTPQAAQQAAATYLAPAELQVLVVGDAATVLPKLRALAAMRPEVMGGQVIVLDGQGNPAPAAP